MFVKSDSQIKIRFKAKKIIFEKLGLSFLLPVMVPHVHAKNSKKIFTKSKEPFLAVFFAEICTKRSFEDQALSHPRIDSYASLCKKNIERFNL